MHVALFKCLHSGQDTRPDLSDIRASSNVPELEVAVQVGGGWELTQRSAARQINRKTKRNKICGGTNKRAQLKGAQAKALRRPACNPNRKKFLRYQSEKSQTT